MARKQKYPQPIQEAPGNNIRLKNQIIPKNITQQLYIESLREATITLGEGPAGAGKTFLVVGIALEKLLNREVHKIIITRPVVESDEKLGFLPGTLKEKLDPYLRPIYDAVEDHVGPTMAKKLIEDDSRIEIAPLAYMRGRTFNNAFVILDEAQNSTVNQMKMFLTRIGENSFYCVNGDINQSDLVKPVNKPASQWENGMQYAIRKLANKTDFVQHIKFTPRDVVRSEAAAAIVAILEQPENWRNDIDYPSQSKYSGADAALFSSQGAD